jgi:hypothetical protein
MRVWRPPLPLRRSASAPPPPPHLVFGGRYHSGPQARRELGRLHLGGGRLGRRRARAAGVQDGDAAALEKVEVHVDACRPRLGRVVGWVAGREVEPGAAKRRAAQAAREKSRWTGPGAVSRRALTRYVCRHHVARHQCDRRLGASAPARPPTAAAALLLLPAPAAAAALVVVAAAAAAAAGAAATAVRWAALTAAVEGAGPVPDGLLQALHAVGVGRVQIIPWGVVGVVEG